jgi:sulfatase modifying factor 1
MKNILRKLIQQPNQDNVLNLTEQWYRIDSANESTDRKFCFIIDKDNFYRFMLKHYVPIELLPNKIAPIRYQNVKLKVHKPPIFPKLVFQKKLTTEKVNSVSFNLIFCQAKKFFMGASSSNRNSFSPFLTTPQNEIQIKHSFLIGETEITRSLWFTVMDDLTEFQDENFWNVPMHGITWFDALAFCNKLSEKQGLSPIYLITAIHKETKYVEYNHPNSEIKEYPFESIQSAKVELSGNHYGYRLPSSAEWELAAIGTEPHLAFAGAIDTNDVAWTAAIHSPTSVQRVKRKKPNSLGLYDMSGNVAEWCADGTHRMKGEDLLEYRKQSKNNMCFWDASAPFHVLRGGSCELSYDNAHVRKEAYASNSGDMLLTTTGLSTPIGMRVIRYIKI